jgi:hypothetical protein
MSERWRIEPEYAMKVDRSLGLLGVLLEPTTVVTKAWEQVLAGADRAWLARLITRSERPDMFTRALERQPDDIKVIIQFAEA